MKTLVQKLSKGQRKSWIQAVNALADQVERWAREEDWSTARQSKTVQESRVGEYAVPVVRVRAPAGEVWLDPVGLDIVAADGRVDLQSWPSLNRVRLLRRGDDWQVITDSNVPLRRAWSKALFVDLLSSLTAPYA
jgi:hypothetical protein